jgi:outer membrane protein assembly factor BamB
MNFPTLYAFAAGCGTGGAACSPIWTGSTGGAIESSPAVSNGVVYVGSDDNKLYAFAVGCASGGGSCSPLWTAQTGGHVFATPAVVGGVVYVGSLDKKMYAFDAAGVTGCSGGVCTPEWIAVTNGAIESSASVGSGIVSFGSDDGNLYAFHTGCSTAGGTCNPLWTANIGSAIRSSTANVSDVIYVGASDGKIYGFKADCATGGATCSALWSAKIGTDIFSSPAVWGGVVYVGSNDNNLYAFELPSGTYHAVSPTRVLDTRYGTGLANPFHSHVARKLTIPGIPSTATAITGNLTVTQQSNIGFLYVGPSQVDNPTSSNLNFPMGDDRANAITVAVGTGNVVWITYAAPILGPTAHVILDLTGYFSTDATGSTYTPVPPKRLLDTRDGTGLSGLFHSRVARQLTVVGSFSGVPSGATAVTGNLTVTQQTAEGFLFVGPARVDNPTSSNLNFPTGDDRANAVTVELSGTGTLWITYAAPTLGPTADVIFDLTGYFMPGTSGAHFVPLNPTRLLDTRVGKGLSGSFKSHVAEELPVVGISSGVPANATAVTGNLTVTQQSSIGFLFVGPDQENNPTSSNLNFPMGDDRANAVAVQLSTSGSLWFTYAAPTLGAKSAIIFDVTGYFAP